MRPFLLHDRSSRSESRTGSRPALASETADPFDRRVPEVGDRHLDGVPGGGGVERHGLAGGDLVAGVDEQVPVLGDVVLDFEAGLQAEGFHVENPNVVSECGCGESFRT